MKTPAKAPAPPQPKQTASKATKVSAALLGCTLASGCPSPATKAQVRPTLPPPAECPPGAWQAMRKLGLVYPGSSGSVAVPGSHSMSHTMRPGPVTMKLVIEPWGKLPKGTLFTGELLFSERFVQGRVTQVHTLDGETYPVCLEIKNHPLWGWVKQKGSGQDTARIGTRGSLEPVERFGEARRYEKQEKR